MSKLAESDYVEFHEMIAERKQLLAALDHDRYWMQEYEKEAERVCGAAGVSDLDALLARLGELEVENKKAVYGCCEECGVIADLERAEAERDALRDAIVDYANGDSKVHPITALSKLVGAVECEGGEG